MAEEGKRTLQPNEKYCSSCGEVISKDAEICPKCGVRQMVAPVQQQGFYTGGDDGKIDYPAGYHPKSWIVALILSIFLGGLGIHRFYTGKIGTGIIWLITGGCGGIGWLIDIIMIAISKFTDKHGYALKH
jgi:hypothetical protein